MCSATRDTSRLRGTWVLVGWAPAFAGVVMVVQAAWRQQSCARPPVPPDDLAYAGAGTSIVRPWAAPKSQTSMSGGGTPRAVSAVQIWLRWSLP